MSLVKLDREKSKVSWSQRDTRATRHKLPALTEKPVVDYSKLRQLCIIDGLKSITNNESSQDAHRDFMNNYRQMFVQEEPKKGFPIHAMGRSMRGSQASVATSTSKSVAAGDSTLEHALPGSKRKPKMETSEKDDGFTHDIRDYLPLLHQQRRSEHPQAVKTDRIKTLRRLLKKLSFERSAAENDEIYNAVKHFSQLSCQVEPDVLKELCVVAQLDVWKEEDITLFGNTGFHLILRGKVKPHILPYVILRGQDQTLLCPTPEPDEEPEELGTGECFGTLEKIEGRDPNSRILTVSTVDNNCEFLKITCSDYARVIEQIRQRDETEKVNLLQSCEAYKLWSKQPLIKVASLINWVKFPANTVLVSEGYRAPFLTIIKTGECHVLRHVEVLTTLPNGKQETQTKQVVMGKLLTCASFGEISVIREESMTCSIVTATAVELACIEPNKLMELDDVTLQLLEQSSVRTYGDLTQDDIHQEYVRQELKREWNEFKHNVVVEAINSRGIRPGYGKWSK